MKSILRILIVSLLICLGFLGCRTSDTLTGGQSPNFESSSIDSTQVSYTAIYVIHGDASYLYHDQEGNPLQADEEKVKEAMSVAQQSGQGEVFIFYQKPERKVFGIFPKKDRILLHYRNGELIHRERYSPASSDRSLVTESKLFKKYRFGDNNRMLFLYFGHEIPHLQEVSYHKSRPDAEFDIENFSTGMRSFLDKESKFDLTVLSTCDNGTPIMAAHVQPISRLLLASPQNLHLSHIDTHSLLALENSAGLPALSLADMLAQQTYNRLNGFIETEITLSIYDLEEMSYSLGRLSDKYIQYRSEKSGPSFEQENIDCATLPFWDDEEMTKGIKTFYKSSNFGAYAARSSHSGWGCQRVKDQ